jgi:hypothetical protein
MLGAGVWLQPQYSMSTLDNLEFPADFGWDQGRFPFQVLSTGAEFVSDLNARDLVDPAIWTGVAIHVDQITGDDSNSGLGSADGDFIAAKRTIYSAFVTGNATGAPYRVIVKAGEYEESAFTRNGKDEPNQAVAILGWDGAVRYRTGPFMVNWTDAGGTYAASVSAVKRVFRTDILTPEGHYSELMKVSDLLSCQATLGTWFLDGGTVHVNVGAQPVNNGIALIRSFHGARFMTHTSDIYLEDIHCEGGITGALHFDPVSDRNIIGVNCSFKYSAPSNSNAPLDAVRIRRTNGLVAFFDSDASMGAKDGWSFHEDGNSGMHVLLQNCTGVRNGIDPATSCNGFTTHDAIRSVVLGGAFGLSHNGSEVHCIQSTQSWLVGVTATARDIDGTSVAFKCSNQASMWLQNTKADAAGAVTNYAIEANAGTVFTRSHTDVAGTYATSVGGTISGF